MLSPGVLLVGESAPVAADCAAVEAVLAKVLVEGRLLRIPKHPDHRTVVLAIVCLGLERRYPYGEVELNEVLRVELDRFRADVDHVTCRRYLVDLGFVKRDRAGSRYYLNFPHLESVLDEAARKSGRVLIQEALACADERERRRRQRPAGV